MTTGTVPTATVTWYGWVCCRLNVCSIIILFDEDPEAGIGPCALEPDITTVVLTQGASHDWQRLVLPNLSISKPAPTSSRVPCPLASTSSPPHTGVYENCSRTW